MNDEFDFSFAQKPEDPTMAAQTDAAQPAEQTAPQTDAEPAAQEASPEAIPQAESVSAPEQSAPQTEAAQTPNPQQPQNAAEQPDQYQNPFEPAAPAAPTAQQAPYTPPYTPYPYGQPQQARPAYQPYVQQPYNAQQNVPPYVPPTPPYRPYAPQQNPQPPYGAPQQPYAPQNYWYAQQQRPSAPQNGAVPPAPPVNNTGYSYAQQPPQTPPQKKKNGGRVVLWVLAAILEVIIVGFAIYGVYALATGGTNAPADMQQRPGYSQQMPNLPGSGDDDTASESSDGTSSTTSNYTNVQLGIVCLQLTDEAWTQYGMDPGLIVDSISDDSNAKNTELQAGDVITAANGTAVKTFDDLFAIMDQLEPGDEITLTAYRVSVEDNAYKQGEPFTVTFQVKEKTETASSSAASDYPQA